MSNTIRRAEQILGYGITKTSGKRYFTVVDGVIYTDLYTGEVTLPFTDKFKKAFNGRVNGMTYFNEIRLDTNCYDGKDVELELAWGSTDFDDDIQGLTDWIEDTGDESLDNVGVKSKKIEDFNVSYSDAEETEDSKQSALIDTYGFYIRRPLIIGISSEQKHNERHF